MRTDRKLMATVAFIAAALTAACSGGGYTTSVGAAAPSAIHAPQTGIACAVPRLFAEYKAPMFHAVRRAPRRDCAGKSVSFARENSSGIISFDVPGSANAGTCSEDHLFEDCGTQGLGINAGGSVVGVYLTSRMVLRAFLRTPDGQFRTFQARGAGTGFDSNQGTEAVNLTNAGSIVGFYVDASYVYHAFIRPHATAIQAYEAPYASRVPNDSVHQGTLADSVNPSLDTAGAYFDSQGLDHAFIRYRERDFVRVDPPGAVQAVVCAEDCLTPNRAATGTFVDSAGNEHGYLRNAGGSFTIVDAPKAASTYSLGINSSGEIVGAYLDANGVSWSYIRDKTGKFVTFQAPGAWKAPAEGTQASTIDAAGNVAGAYADDAGEVHGFVRFATGRFSEFDPSGSIATFPQTINAYGDVTGVWFDYQGQNHGFIWKPQ